MIEFGHGTHRGLLRKRNEDAYYADASLGLFLVADGMGGHGCGDLASSAARDTVVDLVSREHYVAEALLAAGNRLLAETTCSAGAQPVGTTLAAIRLQHGNYEAAWVGDSRIYLVSDTLQPIRHDHAAAQTLIDAGKLEPVQAQHHPHANVLTQALGITASGQLRIGTAAGVLPAGTGVLLCTDGVTEHLDDTAIFRIARRTDLAAQECVDHLILEALADGGSDNITAVLLRRQ